jgi:hypothetical protein
MTSQANQDHQADHYGRILPPKPRRLPAFLWGFAGAGAAFLVLIVITWIAGA